jgi:hypothetical protein
MLYLYLDESGDIGLDFTSKKPSEFFTITILAVNGTEQNRKLFTAVKKTINRKLKDSLELKGSKSRITVKKYFFDKVKNISFSLYAISVDKRNFKKPTNVKFDQHRLYNSLTRKIVEQILSNELVTAGINLIVDKSKNKKEIEKFNQYILLHIKSKIDFTIPIDIEHDDSVKNYGLQACDIFCSGIFQSHESGKTDWLDIFKEKVKCDLTS